MLTHDKRPAGAQALSSEKTTDCITVAETSTISQPDEDSGYDSDFWDTPEDKKAKADHYKRVEERGSWLAFLGDLAEDFKIVLPLLWPSGNLKVQICLAIQLAKLVADRAWTVLIPLQLGRLTNELMLTAGTGVFPTRSLIMWMLFVYLDSSVGLSILPAFAELPASQFAYKRISGAIFSHVMHLDMEYHSDRNSGELIAGIHRGQSLYYMLQYLIVHVSPLFLDLSIAIFYMIYLFDVNMAILVIVSGVVYSWVGSKTAAWSRKERKQHNKTSDDENQILTEAIGNWQTVSHFNRVAHECSRYETAIDKINEAEWQSLWISELSSALQGFISVSTQLAVATLALYQVSQGHKPIGNFVTLMTYWKSIESPIRSVAYSFRHVSRMIIDCDRVLELLKTKPKIIDAPDAVELKIADGNIRFDRVDFSYDLRKRTLTDVSFSVNGGQTVALVGETGGGKSTILKLFYRYYDVSAGSITIDDQDIRSVTLDSLRECFGMVPQDPSLFNISIIENVRYARLNATDDEVHEACKAAAIHDKILGFPDGYKSKVGERGVKLSGGELQRVAIARAILRNSPIVLLDEATSMVDTVTESLIQDAFKQLTTGRTTFVVAHRLSTVQDADLILVVQDGEIIERGTHSELFARKGKYLELWSKQFSKQTVVP